MEKKLILVFRVLPLCFGGVGFRDQSLGLP